MCYYFWITPAKLIPSTSIAVITWATIHNNQLLNYMIIILIQWITPKPILYSHPYYSCSFYSLPLDPKTINSSFREFSLYLSKIKNSCKSISSGWGKRCFSIWQKNNNWALGSISFKKKISSYIKITNKVSTIIPNSYINYKKHTKARPSFKIQSIKIIYKNSPSYNHFPPTIPSPPHHIHPYSAILSTPIPSSILSYSKNNANTNNFSLWTNK